MRNEDLKKRFKEEKTVLKVELTYISLFLICLSSFTNIFGQVPLNGFCRFKQFAVNKNSEKIIPVDFNGDGYRDFITYNSAEKKYNTIAYNSAQKKIKSTEKYSPYHLTGLRSLGEDKKGTRKFAFTSRKERTAGIVSFSKSGSFLLNSKIKFDSYPKNIDHSDINKDGKQELLVSGPSFNGLVILSESRKGFLENVITTNQSFQYSSFIDLDYDSYDDIAAVDNNSSSIVFFYNDRTGGFSKQRVITQDSKISEFITADVNLDGFNDLVFLKNKKPEVLLGDSVSSFQKKIIIDSRYPVDKYSIYDFNGDGYNDIALLNYDEGILSIAFGKNGESFFPPVICFKRKGIVDLAAFVDRGGRKLSALDSNGEIYIIDKLTGKDDDFSLAVGASPSVVGMFNYKNDKSPDYFLIDKADQQLKLFLSSHSNIFDKYVSFGLSQNASKITIDETDPTEKIFYCYTPGGRIIEILRIELDKGSYSRKIVYADGPICDLKLTGGSTNPGKSINVLIIDKGKLLFQSFKYRDFRYLKSGVDSIAFNVEAALLPASSQKEIYFFTRYGNTSYLNKASGSVFNDAAVNISSFELNTGSSTSVGFVSIAGNSTGESPIISIINDGKNSILNILFRGNHNSLKLNDFAADPANSVFHKAFGLNRVFLFDNYSGKLKRILFPGSMRGFDVSDVFESETLNSYIVAPINYKKEFLIFTDSVTNLLNFRTIQ